LKRHFGLIGNPLTHSFSEKYFNEKFQKEGISDASYHLFPLTDISDIRQLITVQQLSGFNVTIPYKSAIIPFLDELSAEAEKIGAVNTVTSTFQNDRLFLKGLNTDAPAFGQSISGLHIPQQAKALILGNGGASKAVQYALNEMGINFTVVSRSGRLGTIPWSGITQTLMEEHLLIINTTPLGMAPNINECPDLPYHAFSGQHRAYDLIYNPEKTLFLLKAEQNGASIMNGSEMLHNQAELAWKIWQRA